MLAEELSEWEEAKSYYLQALTILFQCEDEQSLNLVVNILANFYQKTQDNSLITEFATMFEMTEAKVIKLFQQLTTGNQ